MKKQSDSTHIRMGELKAIYQRKAMELDRSTHWLILSVLKKEPFVTEALKKIEKKERK